MRIKHTALKLNLTYVRSWSVQYHKINKLCVPYAIYKFHIHLLVVSAEGDFKGLSMVAILAMGPKTNCLSPTYEIRLYKAVWPFVDRRYIDRIIRSAKWLQGRGLKMLTDDRWRRTGNTGNTIGSSELKGSGQLTAKIQKIFYLKQTFGFFVIANSLTKTARHRTFPPST